MDGPSNVAYGLLPAAARTTAQVAKRFTNLPYSGARVILVITAASGTGGLTTSIRGYDKYGNPYSFALGAAVITTGTFIYEMYVATVTAAAPVTGIVARHLPADFDITVGVGDGSSYTYSLAVELFNS